MQVSFVDLRKKTREILQSLKRNEPVTVCYRGTPTAIMHPIRRGECSGHSKVEDHPAFGMWADREDMADVSAYVRRLREGRFDGF